MVSTRLKRSSAQAKHVDESCPPEKSTSAPPLCTVMHSPSFCRSHVCSCLRLPFAIALPDESIDMIGKQLDIRLCALQLIPDALARVHAVTDRPLALRPTHLVADAL